MLRAVSNMSYYLILLLISMLDINTSHEAARLVNYRKYVNQKDMTEYCQRRVAPSIFISRQITEANAQVLYFAGREVPYSCFINIRTEIGSNIIVVIQVLNDKELKDACEQGNNQLIVYEMGESFGAYWGQMPKTVMKSGKRRRDRSYTLKRRPTTVTTASTTKITTTSTTTVSTKNTKRLKDEDTREYIIVELPIMNVSAVIVPGRFEVQTSFTTQDSFDIAYDVTPRTGESYDTSMLPLLEFAIRKNKDNRRKDDTNDEMDPSHELEVQFNDLFTPDPRLTLAPFDPSIYTRRTSKTYTNANRFINFKKNKRLFAAKHKLNNKRLLTFRRPPLYTLQPTNDLSKFVRTNQENYNKIVETPYSWNVIHDMLKNLSQTVDVPTQPPHQELVNFLRGVSSSGFNKSAYLATNTLPADNKTGGVKSTQQSSDTTKRIVGEQQPSSYITNTELNGTRKLTSLSQDSYKSFNKSNVLNHNESALNNVGDESVALLPLVSDVDSIITNVTNQNRNRVQDTFAASSENKATVNDKKSDSLTVSLVDHESWENVVNAAPVMADKLNHSKDEVSFDIQQLKDTRGKRSKVRKKRRIHAVAINYAKPHKMPRHRPSSTTAATDNIDVHEFQQLIELQDDEIQDRMSMKYVRQFLGPPLLDLCAVGENFTNHVYLFNSSRLVFSIFNFTLKRMMVVLTPTHTLLDCETRCAAGHLECQVSGARVCIDSLSACDGVPNCGSFDIYDEDRLTCGASIGSQDNTILAAITFLASLLTMLYAIHYWLKRCVPRVSDAFFIYTDAAENVLYLDSIMRSPHDIGDRKPNIESREAMLEYMVCEDIPSKDNACKRFMKRCLTSLRCWRKKSTGEDDDLDTEMEQFYSRRLTTFAELEISKMGSLQAFQPYMSDVAVQTNSSLEMEAFELSHINKREQLVQERKPGLSVTLDTISDVDLDSNQPSDELNILKFFRSAREKSISMQALNQELATVSELSATKSSKEEKEIQCLEYNPDHYNVEDNTPSLTHSGEELVMGEVHDTKTVVKVCKHLRFQEEVTLIPTTSDEDEIDDIVESVPNTNNRRSIMFGAGKVMHLPPQTKDAHNNGEEPSGSSGREFKSYFNWGSGKEKKKKKPKKK